MTKFRLGQTWVSETEPELGICRIADLQFKRVTVLFPATGERRVYSLENAPLRRVIYQVGDSVSHRDEHSFQVTSIREDDDLFFYGDGSCEFPETVLVAAVDFSDALSRVKMLDFDAKAHFQLRYETLQLQAKVKQSHVRGLTGARMELIPHQLYVVDQIASSANQRVLLADEVGLGKTIEACLLVHRLLLTGQIDSALILVPDALVHQWFVELYCRFNLTFDILDKARFDTLQDSPSLLIGGIDFLSSNLQCAAQVLKADWDILVVDEVHHLEWSEESGGCRGYELVNSLAQAIERVILLSATPEQLGIEGHFARLRLLDPDRYFDLSVFVEEQKHYTEAAVLADKLAGKKELTPKELELLEGLGTDLNDHGATLAALLDRFGTGRAIYRNTRHVTKGFPKRVAKLDMIEEDGHAKFVQYLREEFDVEKNHRPDALEYNYTYDPRIAWLADLLRRDKSEKFLLICHSRQKVMAIREALLKQGNFKLAVFHEEMTVMRRDRDAAWFSQPDGAQILLCSEIGSEGRNFQFAHHLILYDLPMNPELLEQRIGRLDRIGQKETIYIHIPYLENSPQEVMAKWYHEGLLMIENHLSGGHEFLEPFTSKIVDLAIHPHKSSEIEELIADTRQFRDALVEKLEKGRDHLLELHSYNARKARKVVEDIKVFDYDNSLESYILNAFDQFRIGVEGMSRRSYLVSPSNALMSLPWLGSEDVIVTCSREKALEHENISFLSWDHPLVNGLLEAIGNATFGNSSFAIIQSDSPLVLVEAVFVAECQAPGELHLDRFMPPVPIRVLVDHTGRDRSEQVSPERLNPRLSDGKAYLLEESPAIVNQLLPDMLERSQELAGKNASRIIKQAVTAIEKQLNGEIDRLRALQSVNPNIKSENIDRLSEQKAALIRHVKQAKTRLDSIRLILGR